jgi:2-polyprenyl-6-methoxyphenol hydroxylase-like FAD-dependent oxidoreductase
MGSTVARLVGARRYHVVPNQRFAYWGYFEGADATSPGALLWDRFDDELCFGVPCDAGLYVACLIPPLDRLATFGEDLEGAFAATLARSERMTARLADSRRVGPLRGMASYPVFFRESAGPGWALVGDAGHFKDPVPGQGISDAFRQAERLAADIVSGLGGAAPLDAVLSDWWAWRDADAIDMHWLGADLGAAGPVPAVVIELIRDLHGSPGGLWDFWGLFHHATRTTDVFTPERLAAVAERVAGTPLGERVMAELVGMAELAEARARLVASPVFVDDSTHHTRQFPLVQAG